MVSFCEYGYEPSRLVQSGFFWLASRLRSSQEALCSLELHYHYPPSLLSSIQFFEPTFRMHISTPCLQYVQPISICDLSNPYNICRRVNLQMMKLLVMWFSLFFVSFLQVFFFLSTQFWNAVNQFSLFNLRKQVSHPYKHCMIRRSNTVNVLILDAVQTVCFSQVESYCLNCVLVTTLGGIMLGGLRIACCAEFTSLLCNLCSCIHLTIIIYSTPCVRWFLCLYFGFCLFLSCLHASSAPRSVSSPRHWKAAAPRPSTSICLRLLQLSLSLSYPIYLFPFCSLFSPRVCIHDRDLRLATY